MANNQRVLCPNCNSTFTRSSSLKVHMTFHCHKVKDDKSSDDSILDSRSHDNDNDDSSEMLLHSSEEDDSSNASPIVLSSDSSFFVEFPITGNIEMAASEESSSIISKNHDGHRTITRLRQYEANALGNYIRLDDSILDAYPSSDSSLGSQFSSDEGSIMSAPVLNDDFRSDLAGCVAETFHLDGDDSHFDLDTISCSSASSDEVDTPPTSNEPVHIVEAKLLHLITTHSIPLYAYSQFMAWGKLVKESSDFSFDKPTNFTSTVAKVTKQRSMIHNTPKTVEVAAIPQNARVRVLPFLHNVRRLYSLPDIMQNSLWRYNATSSVYGELNTGEWWKQADCLLNQRLDHFGIEDKENHFVAPVIFFIDGTHCDRNGRLQAEPVLCSVGNICLEERKSSSAWFINGLLPNKIGTPSERKAGKKGKGLRAPSLRMYHECLGEIYKELIEIQSKDKENGMGVAIYVSGKGMVNLHFEVCLVIGDTVGHDTLCCHYQAYSKKVARPVRTCQVSWEDLDKHDVECQWVNMNEIFAEIDICIQNIRDRVRVTENRERASNLSQQLHISIFRLLSFGGNAYGIFGATPFEVLHTLLLGIMKYSLKSLYDYRNPAWYRSHASTGTGTGIKKPFQEVEFERRVRLLSTFSKRQSDRSNPRAVFNTGVTTLAGIQGQEYVGLSMLSIAALPNMLKDRQLEKKFMDLLWKGISVYSLLTRSEVPKRDIQNGMLQQQLGLYIKCFVDVCGDQRRITSPTVGCKIQRLHGISHFPKQISQFGSAQNFNGSFLESHLKTFIKHPAKRARKTHADFSHDLINRWCEHASITDYLARYVSPPPNQNDVVDQPDADPTGMTIAIGETNLDISEDSIATPKKPAFFYKRIGNIWHTCVGQNYEKKVYHPFQPLDERRLKEIRRFLNQEMRELKVDRVNCYHEMRIPNKETGTNQIYRCNPKYRGKPWYDWLKVKYHHDGTVHGCSSVVPSRLLLWMSIKPGTDEHAVYCLTHSLQHSVTPKYRLLPDWRLDTYFKQAQVVIYSNVVGPIYVLPGISDRHHNDINEDALKNEWYVIPPERSKWHLHGWSDLENSGEGNDDDDRTMASMRSYYNHESEESDDSVEVLLDDDISSSSDSKGEMTSL